MSLYVQLCQDLYTVVQIHDQEQYIAHQLHNQEQYFFYLHETTLSIYDSLNTFSYSPCYKWVVHGIQVNSIYTL
jgi:hypothetical protein